jgi:WD40 repeat protein
MFRSRATEPQTPARYIPISPVNIGRITEIDILRDEQPQPARIVVFSPDGSTLACSTMDAVTLWDVAKRRKKAMLRVPALHVTYSPNGAVLVVSGRDIQFFDTKSGQLASKLKGHQDGTTGVVYNPDGSMLATSGMDGHVRVGNLKTQRLVRTFEHAAPVRGLAFSPDGDTIATVSWGDANLPRRITLWSVKTGSKIQEMKCQTEKNVVYSPDGKYLAVDGTLYQANNLQVAHDLHERVVVFSPDSSLIASCRSDYTTIGVWDAATGDKLLVLKGHSESLWSLAFSPDGTMLASGSGNLDMSAIRKDEDELRSANDKAIHLWGVPEIDTEPTKPLVTTTKHLKRLIR